jgi:two-component system chemotaxis response regulator CheB
MPLETPPILVVQHISPEFAKPFAERLAQISGLKLGPPDEGAPLKNGHIYLSWGDSHIGVRRNGRALVLTRSNAGPVTGHRPSVDFLFKSAALANARAAAALLTGMGGDGALGLLELKNKGNFTLAQDEETSVVYGMPKEAARIGAAEVIGDLQTLRSYLDQMAKANSVPKSESVV